MDEPWATYGRLLILTGQRHGDVMNFHHERLHNGDLHLPTSKDGTPHIVTLGARALTLVQFHCHGFDMATTAHFKRRWFRKAGVPLIRRRNNRCRVPTGGCVTGCYSMPATALPLAVET